VNLLLPYLLSSLLGHLHPSRYESQITSGDIDHHDCAISNVLHFVILIPVILLSSMYIACMQLITILGITFLQIISLEVLYSELIHLLEFAFHNELLLKRCDTIYFVVFQPTSSHAPLSQSITPSLFHSWLTSIWSSML